MLTPITWVTGPTFVQALPPLVLFQVLVLGPIALLCVYGIASPIGGRLLGYWASFLWVVAPFAAIPLFVDRYQERWGEQFLPQALGLTAMADFPSMVLVLASARLRRALARRGTAVGRRARRPPARRGRGAEAAEPASWASGRRSPTSSRGAGEEDSPSARRSSRRSSSSRSGRNEGSASIPVARARGDAARAGAGARACRSTSTATSTSTSTTGARRWTSCASSSGARASRSGRRSPASSPCSACGAARSPRCSRAGSRRSSSSRASRRGRHRVELVLAPAHAGLARVPPPLRVDSACSCRRSRGGSETGCARRRRAPVARALDRRRRRRHRARPGRRDRRLVAARRARARALTQDDAGNFILTPVDEGVELRAERDRRGHAAHVGRRHLACGRLLPRLPRRGRGRRVREHRRASRAVLLPVRARRSRRVREREYLDAERAAGRDLPHRRRHELGRRPRVRGRLRVQSAGRCGRLSRSSSSAIRCARSTFSSVSREITVE